MGAYNTVPIVFWFGLNRVLQSTSTEYHTSYNVTLGSVERSSEDGENIDAFRKALLIPVPGSFYLYLYSVQCLLLIIHK